MGQFKNDDRRWPEGWISLGLLADELGVRHTRVYGWMMQGHIETRRHGTRRFVPKELVNEIKNRPDIFPLTGRISNGGAIPPELQRARREFNPCPDAYAAWTARSRTRGTDSLVQTA